MEMRTCRRFNMDSPEAWAVELAADVSVGVRSRKRKDLRLEELATNAARRPSQDR
jgi:hypothetical protein